jgi:DNA invertase Pin-like site-specific DNA recombinase
MARKSRHTLADVPAQNEAKAVFHVGAYVRLSAVDKKHKGDSIETQQAIISAYIAERQDFILVDTYIDNGLSGQSFERPAFRRMIADIDSGKINCCVTKDLSRLGRSAIDTGYYIEKYFPAQGVRFVAITDSFDSADGQSGGIMVSLKNMVNEAYAVDIGRKIRATKQMNIRNGCFVGSLPPYGYLKAKEDNHKLVPDDNAAPVVLRIFEMAAKGASLAAVTRWLNESGTLSPRYYLHSIGVASDKQKTGNGHWSKSVVDAILHNRVYCGDMVQGKSKTTHHKQKVLPSSQWVITEDTHAAIVSRALFQAVQEREKQNASRNPRYSDPKTENLFLRKVFCGHCGHTMFRRRNGKTQYRFTCSTKTMYAPTDCLTVGINEYTLKEKLVAMLRKQDYATPARCAVTSDSDSAALKDVQAKITQNECFLKGLYESMMSGDITAGEFRDMKTAYENKIAALKQQEKQLRDTTYERIRLAADQKQASMRIARITDVSDFTAETIDALIEKISVFEDESFEVKFRFLDAPIRSEEGMFQ